MQESKALLIIDPQKDFMDKSPKEGFPGQVFPGALAVTGASEDMENLADYIDRKGQEIDTIVVTLDTHNVYDIAHSAWWLDENSNPVAPWTSIKHQDVVSGKYRPVDPSKLQWALEYTKSLEERNKYTLLVWPTHCVRGTWGHEVDTRLAVSLANWELKTGKKVHYVLKGMNPNTENYSVFKAEVPIDTDNDTQLNKNLIDSLLTHKKIEVAGEALSHCLLSSMNDLINNAPKEKISSISLLRDCTSSVTGFEKVGQDYVEQLSNLGVNIELTKKKPALKM